MQSSRNAELALLVGLRNSVPLKYFECRFERGLVGAVTVILAGRVLGAWWYDEGVYLFSTMAYRPGNIMVGTVEEAIQKTQQLVTSTSSRSATSARR